MKTVSTKRLLWLGALMAFIVAGIYIGSLLYREGLERERGFVANYQASEQKRLRIDCAVYKEKTKSFFDSKITPIVVAGREGKAWEKQVDRIVLEEMDTQRQNLFECWRIYSAGKDEASIKHAGEYEILHASVTVIDTIFRYGLTDKYPGLEVHFGRVDNEYRKIMTLFVRKKNTGRGGGGDGVRSHIPT